MERIPKELSKALQRSFARVRKDMLQLKERLGKLESMLEKEGKKEKAKKK